MNKNEQTEGETGNTQEDQDDIKQEKQIKQAKQQKHTVKQRFIVTLIVAVAAALLCGFVFYLSHINVHHMHVLFLLVFCVSVLLLLYMVIWSLGANVKNNKLVRVLKQIYFTCLSLGLVCVVILQILIISAANTEEHAHADVVIVLGAGLINDAPSLILASRLNAVVAYVQNREEIPIIVTGGLGAGYTVTEAEAMARYLIASGIDENRIWKEETSINTHENINFARKIMEEKGMDVDNIIVAVASNEFHLYRAILIAKKAGLDAHGIAAITPGWHRQLIYYFRETFSLANELVFR